MKILTQEQIDSFKSFLARHDNFIIVGHKDPDGDCISSCLVAAKIVEYSQKSPLLLSAGPFKRPEVRAYESLFVSELPFMSEQDRKETGLVVVDCSELSRLGELGDLKGFDTFIIDHHKTAEIPEGAQAIIDSTSPAAACLMQMLYEGIAGTPDKETATIMFFGLSTDTGFFRFLREESAEVFELAARLVRYGANPQMMYDKITGGKPYSTRKLLGVLLDHAERYCNGRLVVTFEKLEDTKKYGAEGRDSDMLYQSLLSCEGVDAVVFLRQETEHSCTAGFRSRDEIDVSAIAAKFGGGGHKNASGLSTEGRIETLMPQIIKEFAKVL